MRLLDGGKRGLPNSRLAFGSVKQRFTKPCLRP